MPTRYFPRLAALANDVTATPADQLPRLRKLLETVLRDEYKRRGIAFGNLSQAIGFVAYEHELMGRLRHQLQALRLSANLVLHESYPGTPAEVAARCSCHPPARRPKCGPSKLLRLPSKPKCPLRRRVPS